MNTNNPGQQPIRSTPPGFGGPSGGNRNMNGMSGGDFQEALNNLLSNPQSLCQILGGSSISPNEGSVSEAAKSPIPFSTGSHQSPYQQGMHNGLLQQNMSHLSMLPRSSSSTGGAGGLSATGAGLDQGGVSSAILDLLMQSMKTDQTGPSSATEGYNGLKHQQHQQQHQHQHNAWSSGLSTPPSPIGNNRSFVHNGHGNGNGHHGVPSSMPQRSGSNGSSEMSSSSPRSPSYSPFPRSSTNKGILESGNGNVSPTPTPWSNPVLGSPPNSGGFGAPHQQQQQQHHHHHHHHLPTHHSPSFPGIQTRNIWGSHHSLSPGVSSMNSNNNNNNNNNPNLMNAMGQKRKVNHETGLDMEGFLPTPPMGGLNNGLSPHVVLGASAGHNTTLPPPSLCNPAEMSASMASHYTDTYYKRKKKT